MKKKKTTSGHNQRKNETNFRKESNLENPLLKIQKQNQEMKNLKKNELNFSGLTGQPTGSNCFVTGLEEWQRQCY